VINSFKRQTLIYFDIINIWNGKENRLTYLLAQREDQMKDLSLSIHHFDVDYLWMPFSIAHQQRIASDHQEEMVKERENGMHVDGVAELCDFDMSTDLMDFGVGQDVYVSEHMGRYPADIAG
jgi:hypothetical protein